MNSDLRSILSDDIVTYRKKREFYQSVHLYEAARYADKLAENIELALTTIPEPDDPKID